ncbi:PP2C family protein-serine/threonine phosphatase [Frigoribacterium sp. MEB024]|uniref:PP2C family protein-serine/threonine phosphatase n=1 Tax=Frigoribacterium sp. MEB024 TaxID=1589899 RepID=UPI0009E4982C|nr:SpoIIE family protein phosphatase [Frigoribacterium sp. MEB024]
MSVNQVSDDTLRPSVWGDSGLLGRVMSAGSRRHVPVLKQGFVFFFVLMAALVSTVIPWLPVTDAPTMWAGVSAALFGVAFAAAASWRPRLLAWEIVIPAADFVAVGLLRYGTGDSRSVFVPIILLPIVWIAVWAGRSNIVWLLVGSAVTFLLPFVIDPGGRAPSEFIRIVFSLAIYATVGLAINELARQASRRVELSRAQQHAVEREIDKAATIQQSLLPPKTSLLPDMFAVRGTCIPARTVGGDFYDWYPTPDGIALTVGDVMGKGVGAGMIAAAVRSVIRSSSDDLDPAVALRRATTGLASGDSDVDIQFTTCFHARITPSGEVRWADGGHGLALIRRASGLVERLRSSDLPVGLGDHWVSHTDQLQPGDTIVCISDGVLDLFPDELLAFSAFQLLLISTGDSSEIVQRVAELVGDDEQADDVTVVVATFAPALARA